MINILPVRGIGEVRPGADLGALLGDAIYSAGYQRDLDSVTLVVTQKIVSKAENRIVDLDTVDPGSDARDLAARTGKDPRLVELILAETAAVVRVARNVLITRHRLGFVMANAGIDASNNGARDGRTVLLLPLDPDSSASRIADALGTRFGARPAVIISDSFGRPWRRGVVNVAIGSTGLPSLWDRRGELDRDGRRLEVTEVALADMIAAAAGLIGGEAAEGIPAVLVRGMAFTAPANTAHALVRPLHEDLFQ